MFTQVLQDYSAPLNPRFVPNPYAFLLFKQTGTLDPLTFNPDITQYISEGNLFQRLPTVIQQLQLQGTIVLSQTI